MLTTAACSDIGNTAKQITREYSMIQTSHRNKTSNYSRWYIASVIAILSVTAISKLISAKGDFRALSLEDPLLMVSLRTVLILVGFLELLVVGFLLRVTDISLKLKAIFWLSSAFAAYRIGMWLIGAVKPCSCLGTVASSLGISAFMADMWMKGLLAYLFFGSLFIGLLHHRAKANRVC